MERCLETETRISDGVPLGFGWGWRISDAVPTPFENARLTLASVSASVLYAPGDLMGWVPDYASIFPVISDARSPWGLWDI